MDLEKKIAEHQMEVVRLQATINQHVGAIVALQDLLAAQQKPLANGKLEELATEVPD